jgi:hypothetical protein
LAALEKMKMYDTPTTYLMQRTLKIPHWNTLSLWLPFNGTDFILGAVKISSSLFKVFYSFCLETSSDEA